MDWIDDLRVFLNGKKTILTTVFGVIDYFGVNMGWWDESVFRQSMEMLFWGIFMRQGVAKTAPIDPKTIALFLLQALEAERQRAAKANAVVHREDQ